MTDLDRLVQILERADSKPQNCRSAEIVECLDEVLFEPIAARLAAFGGPAGIDTVFATSEDAHKQFIAQKQFEMPTPFLSPIRIALEKASGGEQYVSLLAVTVAHRWPDEGEPVHPAQVRWGFSCDGKGAEQGLMSAFKALARRLKDADSRFISFSRPVTGMRTTAFRTSFFGRELDVGTLRALGSAEELVAQIAVDLADIHRALAKDPT